jgi:hypothetical protein
MKTPQTVLLVAALLAAFPFLVPDRSTEAQQSPPGPTLLSQQGTADQPAAPPIGVPPQNGDVPQSMEAGPDSLEPEVLTHGPVHEAFAEPVVTDPGEEVIVNKAPPEVINEVPPEFMPEGDNVEWIPGYWGWDDEIEDYIWVSGLWRRIPPGQRWVPGHWTEVERGYTWVAGFWTGAEVADLEYLPYPPETLEQGPNVAAPGDNYFWVPGSWIYQTTSYNYDWQPGYWAPAYDDWCWIPRRYVWTPRGALFLGGYWDYRLPRRGLLFAPVRFWNPGFWGPGYFYRPFYTINPGGLLVNLFIRPGFRHYYFGDYYGPRYWDRGFRPWHRGFNAGRRFSDPLYSFYDSYYRRRGVDFGRRMDGWHDYYDRHPDRRPERTLNVSTRDRGRDRDFGRDFDRDSRSPIRLADSLTRLAESRDADSPRLRRIDESYRSRFDESRQQVRNIERTRSSLERRVRDGADRVRSGDDPTSRDRRFSDDRRGGPPSIADDARSGRTGRDSDSRGASAAREGSRGRLELPRSVQSRIASREQDDSTRGSWTPSTRGPSGRDSQQPPALDRSRSGSSERFDRSGRGSDSASGPRDRSQQVPSSRDRGPSSDRFDRSGRGSDAGRGTDGAPGLRDRIQQTPSTDRSGPSSRSGPAPRSESRPPQVRDRSESPRMSPSPGSIDRGRSVGPQQPSTRQQPSIRQQPSTRQQASPQPAPQRRIESGSSGPRSSGEIRGRSEPRGSGAINRTPQSTNRPQTRSSSPQIRSQPQQPQLRSQPQSRPQIRSQPQSRPQIRSQPQTRSQPQIRGSGSSRPQMRSSSPPQARSQSQGSFRGRSSGGPSNRGGGSGRGRR